MAFHGAKSVLSKPSKRRRGGRKKPAKKVGKRGATVKVKLKGTPEQVQNAAAALAGAANLNTKLNGQ